MIHAWKTRGSPWHFDIRPWGEPMAFQVKTIGGAHDISDKDHGEAHGNYMYVHDIPWLYFVWYFGEPTKLCAYGFKFMFQVLQFSKEKAQDGCRAHTICFRILWITLINDVFANSWLPWFHGKEMYQWYVNLKTKKNYVMIFGGLQRSQKCIFLNLIHYVQVYNLNI